MPALVAARDRSRLPSPAPAHGLTLEAVYYGEGWGGAHDHPLHRTEAAAIGGGGEAEHREGESHEAGGSGVPQIGHLLYRSTSGKSSL